MLKEFIFFISIGMILIGGIIVYVNSESEIESDNSNEEIVKINNESNKTLNLLKMEIK